MHENDSECLSKNNLPKFHTFRACALEKVAFNIKHVEERLVGLPKRKRRTEFQVYSYQSLASIL